MKNIIILLLLVVGGYKAWGVLNKPSVEPLHDEPYLAVYGRDSCGFTRQTIRALQQAGIRFEYMSVDDPAVADVLHSRMMAMGLEVRRYLLPVVDLNNAISTRPDNAQLVANARASLQ